MMHNSTQRTRDIALTHAIKDARDSFLIRVEMFEVVAMETKAKYDAYLSAGFSSEHALFLCKP